MTNRRDPANPAKMLSASGKRVDAQMQLGFRELVALGRLPGWHSVASMGRVDVAPAGTYEIYEAAAPTVPVRPASLANAGALTVSSDDAADTAAEDGAQIVGVGYLDGQGRERLAQVTMAGIGAVAAVEARQTFDPDTLVLTGGIELRDPSGPPVPVTDCYRVNEVFTNRAGVDGENAGILIALIAAVAQTLVAPQRNRNVHAFYAVPKGQVAMVTGVGIQGGAISGGEPIELQGSRGSPLGPGPWQTLEPMQQTLSTLLAELPVWRRMSPLSEVRARFIKTGAAAVNLIAGCDLVVGPDPRAPDPAIEAEPWLFPPRMG